MADTRDNINERRWSIKEPTSPLFAIACRTMDAAGFLYLVAVMDWFSRKVLFWRLSNNMEADFCVEALKEAIAKYEKPALMNSDQGSQFSGFEWTQALKEADVKISPLIAASSDCRVADYRMIGDISSMNAST